MRRTIVSNLVVVLMLGLCVLAQSSKGSKKAPKSNRIDLASEAVGAESKKFPSVVGNWVIAQDEGKKV